MEEATGASSLGAEAVLCRNGVAGAGRSTPPWPARARAPFQTACLQLTALAAAVERAAEVELAGAVLAVALAAVILAAAVEACRLVQLARPRQ